MVIEETFINGLKIIHLEKHMDTRGLFLKVFNSEVFQQYGLETEFKENYFSVSSKNVLRGMHFQAPPYDHTKLVYCSNGKVMDVVLDLRKSSPTFRKYLSIYLGAEESKLLYIPNGCAHGFLSLKDDSIVNYLQTSVYNKLYDKGVRFDSFGMDWGIENAIVSNRDKSFVGLDSFNSPF